MTIPKIIHQTWKTEIIPDTMKNYTKSWQVNHPTWTYMFWTDLTIRDMIRDHYPWFLHYFDQYPHQIMRVDAFRIFVLHRYGGVYSDIDMECFKPLDPLLNESALLLFLEWPGSISNAIMASSPGHPFWEYCFQELIRKHISVGEHTEAWSATGPKFITTALNSYKAQNSRNYQLYPSYFFFPIPWHAPKDDQSGQGNIYPNSYGAHHWQGTWWQEQPSVQSQAYSFLVLPYVIGVIVIILIYIALSINLA